MFFDRFVSLCKQNKVSQMKVVEDIGLSRSSIHRWRQGALPRGSVVASIADYFGVSTDYLLGNEKSAPADDDEDADALDFSNLRNTDGTPVSEEKKQLIMRILSMGLEDTNNLRKWIDFMDDLQKDKK